ncbi:MAG TPA: CHAP domain-containing protein [Acidimicrobiales bacterium]|nr:CHAP domain-containing protein [Acidimicrobiales bacterium]
MTLSAKAEEARRRPRRRPSPRARRRRAGLGLLCLAVVILAAWGFAGGRGRPPAPAWRRHLAAVAASQVGYRTDPPDTYCNRYSAYWGAGDTGCGDANSSEPWCADFAAWVWRQGGVPFAYGPTAGDINAASVTFYWWGVDHHTWHLVGSGYRPQPGDVAVYGLDTRRGTAVHVAVVVRDGSRGPDVVNGDGARTGFSVVERADNQLDADTTHGGHAPLAGYVSPLPPPRAVRHR